LVKVIQENENKTNYFFNEFKNLIDNAINKLHKTNETRRSSKSQLNNSISQSFSRKKH
jgi:hypothetical protein